VALLAAAAAAAERPLREMGLLPEPAGTLMGWESGGEMIQLPPAGELLVQKVRPADCRVVMGFSHAPIDGRVDSWGYNGVVNEYNDSQGYAVAQWNNPPLYELVPDPMVRIKLADKGGFNYLVVRGGFIGAIYRDADAPSGPGNGTPIAVLTEPEISQGPRGVPHYKFWRIAFPEVVRTEQVGFLRRLNLLADVSFYRVGEAAVPRAYSGTMEFAVGEPVADVTALGPDFIRLKCEDPAEQHPSNFERRFFRKGDRAVYLLKGGGEGRAVDLKGEISSDQSQQVHFLTEPLPAGTAIGGVRFDLGLKGPSEDNYVMLTVQDPLVGNQELMRFDARVGKAERIRVLLDVPAQVMAEGRRFWITLSSRQGGQLTPDSKITLLTLPAGPARAEYLADRLLLLKGYHNVMSEARPWSQQATPWGTKFLTEFDGKRWAIQRVRPQLMDLYRTVEHLHALAPEHPIISGQYHRWLVRDPKKAEEIEKAELPAIPGVPRWAQLMDRAARQIAEIPEWWIRNRMAPNGELGGGYSDDTDMVGWWTPSMMLDSEGFAPVARDCMKRIAAGVLQHNLRDGVNLRVTDPLHAYEEGQNILSQMPLAFYGHPLYVEWLMTSVRTCDKWMLRTPEGALKWRVADFGWPVAQDPPKVVPAKVSGNADLMLHPHLMLAWYNGNPGVVERIAAYSKGMPAGDTGAERAYGGGSSVRFAAYWLTGDTAHLCFPQKTEKGDYGDTWQWFKRQPDAAALAPEARTQPWWPAYVQKSETNTATGHWAWAVKPRRDILVKSLENVLYAGPEMAGVERFRYMWTGAELFTDRIFLPVQPVAQPMLGGYTVRNKMWPSYAVSYEGLGKDFAALVLEQGRDKLKVVMVNLRDQPRQGVLRVWQLDHGRYELIIGPDADDDGHIDAMESARTLELARMEAVPVTLPPRRLTVYEFKQVAKLDDLCARADLAVCDEEVTRDGDAVKVVVHNIGSKAAAKFSVALVDEKGAPVASAESAGLEAPVDLLPRTAVVTLRAAAKAARVVVDPQGAVPEITRLNNSAAVPPK
jgi:hypothetical protein